MDLDVLNPDSRRFAEALLAEFPEWEPYMRIASYDGAEPGTLEVEVPPPHSAGSPLWIDTENDEVTVRFAGWHEHYSGWDGDTGEAVAPEALGAVRDIVEERLLAVLAMDGERWRRAWQAAPGERISTRHGERTRVRSWRGTYDADLTRK
jgi:hypothetical protein